VLIVKAYVDAVIAIDADFMSRNSIIEAADVGEIRPSIVLVVNLLNRARLHGHAQASDLVLDVNAGAGNAVASLKSVSRMDV